MRKSALVAAVMSVMLTSGSSVAVAAFTGSATIHFTGAIQHTYRARCEYVRPVKGGPDEYSVRLFFAFRSRSDADDLEISQMRSHAAVGHVNLRTTRAYRVAFYDTDGRTWGAGWQPGSDLGSGTATIGAGVRTGRLTAILSGVTERPAPLHVTVSWECG